MNDDLNRAILDDSLAEVQAVLATGASLTRGAVRPVELALRLQADREAGGGLPDFSVVVALLQGAKEQGLQAADLVEDPIRAFHQHLRQALREAMEEGLVPWEEHLQGLEAWFQLGVQPMAPHGDTADMVAALSRHAGALRFASSDVRALLGGLLTRGMGYGLDPKRIIQAYQAEASYTELQAPLAIAARQIALAERPAQRAHRRPRS